MPFRLRYKDYPTSPWRLSDYNFKTRAAAKKYAKKFPGHMTVHVVKDIRKKSRRK